MPQLRQKEQDGTAPQGKVIGRGKKGVGGVDDEEGGDTDADATLDLGDLELCAVKDVNHTSAEHIGASVCDDFPPGLPRMVYDDAW